MANVGFHEGQITRVQIVKYLVRRFACFDIGFDIIWYYEITCDLIIPNALPNLSNALPARCLRREVKNLIKISSSRAGRAFGTI